MCKKTRSKEVFKSSSFMLVVYDSEINYQPIAGKQIVNLKVNLLKGACVDLNKRVVCGIDEAGRGPLAGPLVIAAAVLTSHIEGVDDSKRLSAKRRELLYEIIKSRSIYEISIIKCTTIDKIGLSASIRSGLEQLLNSLDEKVHRKLGMSARYIFDGNNSFGLDTIETLVKGDSMLAQIAAASILAKVTRDKIMVDFDKLYSGYGFAKHFGYGTKEHKRAIFQKGLTPIHRKSFKGTSIPLINP